MTSLDTIVRRPIDEERRRELDARFGAVPNRYRPSFLSGNLTFFVLWFLVIAPCHSTSHFTATCTGPDDEPLRDITFWYESSRTEGAVTYGGILGSVVSHFDPVSGKFEIFGDRPIEGGSEVRLVAHSDSLGCVELACAPDARDVSFRFERPGAIEVRFASGPAEGERRFVYLFGSGIAHWTPRRNFETSTRFTPLQPGEYQVISEIEDAPKLVVSSEGSQTTSVDARGFGTGRAQAFAGRLAKSARRDGGSSAKIELGSGELARVQLEPRTRGP